MFDIYDDDILIKKQTNITCHDNNFNMSIYLFGLILCEV